MPTSTSTHAAMSLPRERRKAQRLCFTETKLAMLRPRSEQFQVWDAGTGAARGLSVLVSPTGTRSFRVVYYFPGSPTGQSMHLGRVGELTLEEARTRASAAGRMASEGIDPKAADPRTSDSVKDSILRYVQQRQIAKKQNKTALSTQGIMLNHCAPWLARPIATIRAHEIERLLAGIRDGVNGRKPAPYMAIRMYGHLSDFFKWLSRPGGAITVSPMLGLETPWDGAKPRERDWFKGDAADAAVKAIWAAAKTIGDDAGDYLKVLLLTGKRRAALAAMRWEEIGPDNFWNPPASTSKNKRLHGIPLPALAMRIIGPRQNSGPVFEIVSRPSFNFDLFTQRIRRETGIDDFILHGLRHLLETKLGELRVPPHIRDCLFDHSPNRGSGGGYDHGSYRDEMHDALEMWSEHVSNLVASQGVALFR